MTLPTVIPSYCTRILIVVFLSACLISGRKGSSMIQSQVQEKTMYKAKDFSHLLGASGLSDELLKNHFKLYEGYVKNTNDLLEKLEGMSPETKPSVDYSEIRRRLGFEFCGMRLHEYYFGNLTKDGKSLDPNSALSQKINENFGDFETWRKHFIATGMMRGIGWAVLYYDPHQDRLINVWIDEHQVNNLPGCEPILVMDVWEHAFMLDYQLEKAKYIEAFCKNVDWDAAAKRFDAKSKK